MFFHKLQSVLALLDIVLMQTQRFFCEDSHGDLTARGLSIGSFVVYGIFAVQVLNTDDRTYIH